MKRINTFEMSPLLLMFAFSANAFAMDCVDYTGTYEVTAQQTYGAPRNNQFRGILGITQLDCKTIEFTSSGMVGTPGCYNHDETDQIDNELRVVHVNEEDTMSEALAWFSKPYYPGTRHWFYPDAADADLTVYVRHRGPGLKQDDYHTYKMLPDGRISIQIEHYNMGTSWCDQFTATKKPKDHKKGE